jgi:hypothetical protein
MAEAQAGVVGVLEGKVAVAARATPAASDTGRLRDEAPIRRTQSEHNESAHAPIADIARAFANGRDVPTTDSCSAAKTALFNCLVGAAEQREAD